jgi:hypothetical protein
MATPIHVFASYSHHDEDLHDQLAKHLMPLEREDIIRRWHDRKITAGKEFASEIDTELNSSRIILLLVSPDFMSSEYCWGTEMTRAMQRHEARDARVIPVILRPTDWKESPFGKLRALPTDGNPVTTWSNQDEAMLDVAQGIRAVAAELNSPCQGPTGLHALHQNGVEGSGRRVGEPVANPADSRDLLQQRRLSAIDRLWSATLDLKEKLSAPVFFFGILLPSEYDSALDRHDTIGALVTSITDRLIVESLNSVDGIENDRPYLGEKLWGLFFVYRAFLGRLAHLIVEGKRRHHIADWREDHGVRQLLGHVLPATEVELLFQAKEDVTAVTRAVDTLQLLILVEIRHITSGA